ncbi:hypothetical protein DFH06DRAFT_1143744 [Mycena polygramma]|nr:hypothetical protein DFH06DRAFT_1143744 [Mycena polygramma]
MRAAKSESKALGSAKSIMRFGISKHLSPDFPDFFFTSMRMANCRPFEGSCVLKEDTVPNAADYGHNTFDRAKWFKKRLPNILPEFLVKKCAPDGKIGSVDDPQTSESPFKAQLAAVGYDSDGDDDGEDELIIPKPYSG